MPVISEFFGMVIQMFYGEHPPAHFHVQYAEFKAAIDIERLELIKGYLPRRALALVLDWAELHQKELLEDWLLCQTDKNPKKIEPLR